MARNYMTADRMAEKYEIKGGAEGFFEYLVEVYTNGNFRVYRELISEMQQPSFARYIAWLQEVKPQGYEKMIQKVFIY